MSEKTPYWQLLQDPRWQKKRLEIFARDEFTCQDCGATDKPLHVHHWYYFAFGADRKPWEYPDMALVTLCNVCHKAEDNRGEELNDFESLTDWVFRCLGGMKKAEAVAELISIFRRGSESEEWFLERLKEQFKDS